MLPDIRGLRPETALALVTSRQKQAEWTQAKTKEARQAAWTALVEARKAFDKQARKEKPVEPAANPEDAAESSTAEDAGQGSNPDYDSDATIVGEGDGEKADARGTEASA